MNKPVCIAVVCLAAAVVAVAWPRHSSPVETPKRDLQVINAADYRAMGDALAQGLPVRAEYFAESSPSKPKKTKEIQPAKLTPDQQADARQTLVHTLNQSTRLYHAGASKPGERNAARLVQENLDYLTYLQAKYALESLDRGQAFYLDKGSAGPINDSEYYYWNQPFPRRRDGDGYPVCMLIPIKLSDHPDLVTAMQAQKDVRVFAANERVVAFNNLSFEARKAVVEERTAIMKELRNIQAQLAKPNEPSRMPKTRAEAEAMGKEAVDKLRAEERNVGAANAKLVTRQNELSKRFAEIPRKIDKSTYLAEF